MTGDEKMKITEAGENYLETVLILSKRQETVHAVDICTELGFSRPTVSEMVKTLKAGEFITVDSENHIRLTPSGTQIAERVYERHSVISKMLMSIGVSEKTAHEDACKIEHDISDQTFEAICRHTGATK